MRYTALVLTAAVPFLMGSTTLVPGGGNVNMGDDGIMRAPLDPDDAQGIAFCESAGQSGGDCVISQVEDNISQDWKIDNGKRNQIPAYGAESIIIVPFCGGGDASGGTTYLSPQLRFASRLFFDATGGDQGDLFANTEDCAEMDAADAATAGAHPWNVARTNPWTIYRLACQIDTPSGVPTEDDTVDYVMVVNSNPGTESVFALCSTSAISSDTASCDSGWVKGEEYSAIAANVLSVKHTGDDDDLSAAFNICYGYFGSTAGAPKTP